MGTLDRTPRSGWHPPPFLHSNRTETSTPPALKPSATQVQRLAFGAASSPNKLIPQPARSFSHASTFNTFGTCKAELNFSLSPGKPKEESPSSSSFRFGYPAASNVGAALQRNEISHRAAEPETKAAPSPPRRRIIRIRKPKAQAAKLRAEDAKAHARIASEEVVQTSLKTSEKEREEKHEHLMQQMRSDHQAQMNDIQSLRETFHAQVNANAAARANIAAEEVEADNESRNHAQLSSGSHCAVVNSATLGSNFTKLCEQVAKSIPSEERAEMQEAMAKPDFPETLRRHTDEYLTQSKLAKINADAAACTNIAAEETTAVPDTFSPQKEAPTVSSAVGTEAASTKEEPFSPAPKPATTTKQQTAAKKTQQQAAAMIPPAKNDEHTKPSPRSAVKLTDETSSNIPHAPDKIQPAIKTQQEATTRIPTD